MLHLSKTRRPGMQARRSTRRSSRAGHYVYDNAMQRTTRSRAQLVVGGSFHPRENPAARGALGSNAIVPIGSVAQVASKAAALMAMRIIGPQDPA
ncbi:MAG TPA: hypothetical protein VFE60_17610 [Roseiarcus sp.]|nr:hypothetical protein [Roseiarcus sp.]